MLKAVPGVAPGLTTAAWTYLLTTTKPGNV